MALVRRWIVWSLTRDLTILAAMNATAPGASFTIETGKFLIMSGHLNLTGTQRVTLQGTARLRIT